MTRLFPVLALLAACSEKEPEVDHLAEAQAKCPHVHIDKMAADWILFGARADHKHRMRIVEKDGGYGAYYIGGGFEHLTMSSERRPEEIVFTEIPTAKKKEYLDAGQALLTRVFAKPKLEKCALQVFVATVDPEGKERLDPRPKEFVEFPESDLKFSYLPNDMPLFVDRAAKDKAKADKELADLGGPNPGVSLGEAVPTGGWSKASADGDAGCNYDMDLYFDDQLKQEKVPAGKVQGEFRHWYHEWNAPYGGNHHFQMYRYRKCSGGERTLIGVAGIEAVMG